MGNYADQANMDLYWKIEVPLKTKVKTEYVMGCQQMAEWYAEKREGKALPLTREELAEIPLEKIKDITG